MKLLIILAVAFVIALGFVVFFVDWSPESEESEDERICAHTGEW